MRTSASLIITVRRKAAQSPQVPSEYYNTFKPLDEPQWVFCLFTETVAFKKINITLKITTGIPARPVHLPSTNRNGYLCLYPDCEQKLTKNHVDCKKKKGHVCANPGFCCLVLFPILLLLIMFLTHCCMS